MEFADAVGIIASKMNFDDKIRFAMLDTERIASHVFGSASVGDMLKRIVSSAFTAQLALARLIVKGTFGQPKPHDAAGPAVEALLRNSMRQVGNNSTLGMITATELWIVCGPTNLGDANPFVSFLREQLTPGVEPAANSPLGRWLRLFVGSAGTVGHLLAAACGRELLDAERLQDDLGAPYVFAALMFIESIGYYAVDGFPVGCSDSVRRPPMRSCCLSLGQLAHVFDAHDLLEAGRPWALSVGFSEAAADMIKKRIEWRLVSIFSQFVPHIPMKDIVSLSGHYLP